MAIPSVPQQIALMQAAATEEKSLVDKKQSMNSTLNKMYNVKVMTSTERIGQMRQLHCDTVTKKDISQIESEKPRMRNSVQRLQRILKTQTTNRMAATT
jgi:dGTP triphosphohydrolase